LDIYIRKYTHTHGFLGIVKGAFVLEIRLYLDAEVLVLPPVFLPQDSVFVGRRLRRHPTLAALGLAET